MRESWHRYRGVKTGLTVKTVIELIRERYRTDPSKPLGEPLAATTGLYEYQGVIYTTNEQPWRILR